MKYLVIFPLVFVILFYFPTKVVANLLINEFSSSTAEDWVEIYNSSSDPVLLSDFRLRDSTASNKLDLEGTIQPHTVIAVDWNNRLNKTGDTIKIVSKSDENKVDDQITYGTTTIPAPGDNQTTGRKTNGANDWALFASATKGSSNETATVLSPTQAPTATAPPSPTPSKTPTPTKVPTPTKIPTETKAVAPTKVPTATKTQAQSKQTISSQTTIKPNVSSELATADVLSASDATHPTTTLLEEVEEKAQKEDIIVGSASKDNTFIKLIPIVGGLASLAFCGILLYLYYRKNHG